jgi:hypothetical protein
MSNDTKRNAAQELRWAKKFFTPERLAALDRIAARIDAGERTYTGDEVQAHFDKKRAQWLKDHPRKP